MENQGLGVCLSGKLIKVPRQTIKNIGQREHDLAREAPDQGLDEAAKHIVATSSAEAELHAGNRDATESLGVQAFANDLGGAVPIRLHIDSSAALSIISRTGLGKAKQSTTRSSTCGFRRRSAITS